MKRALKVLGIIIFLTVFAVVVHGFGYNTGLRIGRSETHLNSDKLWIDIQQWRVSQGLPQYIKDPKLCDIADKRAPEIVKEENNNTPHAGFDKTIAPYGNGKIAFAENNTGALSEQDALDRWLHSASHAATLRHDYKYSCVATDGKQHAVEIFSNL